MQPILIRTNPNARMTKSAQTKIPICDRMGQNLNIIISLMNVIHHVSIKWKYHPSSPCRRQIWYKFLFLEKIVYCWLHLLLTYCRGASLRGEWWVGGGPVMIQGAQSWTGVLGIIDIYCFRAPSEMFSGPPPGFSLVRGEFIFLTNSILQSSKGE